MISTLETGDTVCGVAFYPRSTWAVAIEGSTSMTHDSINVLNVLGGEQGTRGKLSGHAGVPIAVDIDCAGRRVATLHANAEVNIWPGEALRSIPHAPPPTALSRQTADDACQYVLSADPDDFGRLYLTSTETAQNLLEGLFVPSQSAAIDPKGRFLVRTYWESLPISPDLSGGPEAGDAKQQWFEHFTAQTRVLCSVHSISGLKDQQRKLNDPGGGYELVDRLGETVSTAWQLPPGMTSIKTLIGVDGRWGASLLKDPVGRLVVFRFDLVDHRSWLDPLPDDLAAATILLGGDPALLFVALVRDDVTILAIDPLAEDLEHVLFTYLGLGAAEDITVGPLLSDHHRCIVGRGSNALCVLEAEGLAPEPGGVTSRARLVPVARHEHCRAIQDACVSQDGTLLAILDTLPSISVLTLPGLELQCWRPLDQPGTRVFMGHANKRILVVEAASGVGGLGYHLMDLM